MRKTWFGGVFKPKNLHSLDHLRYLYSVLSKNQTVSESNRGLLVETLRSIAEILIWGDQNDSSVFDFFLEKNMLSFFLRIMKQKCGSYVCVQLLQTLNILFENIRNETSLYYLLSNNHVNSIIVHKFDFSDEEVMAYYISFLKTLSFKLNNHTIHFFYNEHTNDFPLYTEAIKFFNHPESMVRIAVRTLTLNVYRVNDQSMLQFIRDRTAAPYFSNLVWFIGNHILELDACVRDDIDHDSRDRLSGLVAEHLDHLHYLNDILRLRITPLNHLLAHHLLHRLLLPLLVHSLLPPDTPRHHSHHHLQEVGQPPPLDRSSPRRPRSPLEDTDSDDSASASAGVERGLGASATPAPRVSKVVALFLLAQVFLILSFPPLVHTLARTLLHAGASLLHHYTNDSKSCKSKPGFVAPEESLEKSLLTYGVSSPRRSITGTSLKSAAASTTDSVQYSQGETSSSADSGSNSHDPSSQTDSGLLCSTERPSSAAPGATDDDTLQGHESHRTLREEAAQLNITDEEKQQLLAYQLPSCCMQPGERSLASRPFLQSVLEALDCRDNDYTALFALCLLYALGHNNGFSDRLLSDAFIETPCQEESEAAATRGPRLVPTCLISDAAREAGANEQGKTSRLDKAEDDANNRRENSLYSNHVGDGGHVDDIEHNTHNNVRRDSDDEALPNFVTNDDRRGSDDTVAENTTELVPPTLNERRSSCKSIDFERPDSSIRLRQGNCQVSSPMALSPNSLLSYSTVLVEKMLHVISHSAQYSSKVRVVTLEVAIQVLRQVVGLENVLVSATNGPTTSLTDGLHPASRSQSPSSNHVKDGFQTVPESSSSSSHNYPTNSYTSSTDNFSYGIDAVSTVDCTTTTNTASVAAATHSSQLTPSCSCPEATADGPCRSCNSLPRASVANCDAPLRKCSFTETDAHKSGSERLSGQDHPSTLSSVADTSSRKSSIPEEGKSKTRLAKRNRPVSGNKALLSDEHLAVLEGAREEATLVLRNFYKSEEMFLDLFEDEWNCCNNSQSAASRGSSGRSDSVHVEYLLQDSNVLLPPTATPLTGIHLNKRRPCGEVERARRAMRVFFLVRGVCLAMRGERDAQLPLTRPSACVRVHDVLDLNNSDLIACVVITRDGERSRRFLVIDVLQLILVEPDQRRLGWGVAKFVGFLQDLEVTGDKDDSRVLHLTLHRPAASASPTNSRAAPPAPLLAAKFIFDDHIRCMAAKQRLCKGRNKARQRKLHQIARLLELPSHLQPCPSPPGHALSAMRQEAHHHHRRGLSSQRTTGSSEGRSSRYGGGGSNSSRYSSRGPGRATQHVASGGGGSSGAARGGRASPESVGDHRHGGSRQQIAAGVEEIQLEDIGAQQSIVVHPTLRRL